MSESIGFHLLIVAIGFAFGLLIAGMTVKLHDWSARRLGYCDPPWWKRAMRNLRFWLQGKSHHA